MPSVRGEIIRQVTDEYLATTKGQDPNTPLDVVQGDILEEIEKKNCSRKCNTSNRNKMAGSGKAFSVSNCRYYCGKTPYSVDSSSWKE